MKEFILTALLIFTVSCGGSSGGGGSSSGDSNSGGGSSDDANNGGGTTNPAQPDGGPNGTTNPVDYPLVAPDPKYVGDKIAISGKTFTLTHANDADVNFDFKGRTGYIFDFEMGQLSGNTRVYPMAMANGDARIVAGRLSNTRTFPEPWMFGYDGNWADNITFSERQFYGYYRVMNPDGTIVGTYPMEINLDLNQLQNSYGVDLDTGEEIYIIFSGFAESTLIGSISDPNADNNPANFGLFGEGGSTIVGGYSYELGSGILLVEKGP